MVCCAKLLRYVEEPAGEDAEARGLRRLMFTVASGMLVAQIVTLPATMMSSTMWHVGSVFTGSASVTGTFFPLSRSRAALSYVMSIVALLCVIGILIVDIASAAESSPRVWTIVVLVMDILLVYSCSLWIQLATMAATLIVLAVVAAEESIEFGLFRAFMLGEDRPVPTVCDCSSPPCSIELIASFRGWFLVVVVLVADYVVTRGFSTKLREQLTQNRCSVQVAERLTELLATYATDAARRVVAEEGAALPARLRDSYAVLLKNLDSYRVYLPDSILHPETDLSDSANREVGNLGDGVRGRRQLAVQPPGLGEESPHVAICFTDIQSSTELWESFPQGMYDALDIHNTTLRDVYCTCSGYEVKTIGDSFMIAFADVLSALRFGLQAQISLLRQRWPEDLLTHPLCTRHYSPSGQLLWGGLRVRIGVQCGPVRIDRNPVTQRCDYFGHVVNTAARLEAVLRKGGLMATTAAALDEIGPGGRVALEHPVVYDVGFKELKGVREPLQVYALCTQELSLRLSILGDSPSVPPDGSRAGSMSLAGSGSEGVPGSTRRPSGSTRSCGSISAASVPSPSHTRHQSADSASLPSIRCFSRTRAQMRRASATCAAVRAALRRTTPVEERVQAFVSAVALAADKSTGVVDSVLSAVVTVSWNTSRSCAEHAAACRNFIVAPFRAPCHLGVASGAVLTGNIAAGRRCFATVIGACVELATALAEEAECCQDRALATGHVALECAAAEHAFRAQLWQPVGEAFANAVEVWEIDVEMEQNDEKWKLGLEDSQSADPQACAASGESLPGLFRAACSATPGTDDHASTLAELQALSLSQVTRDLAEGQAAGNGNAVCRLLRRVESGTARIRPVPSLWAPDCNEVGLTDP